MSSAERLKYLSDLGDQAQDALRGLDQGERHQRREDLQRLEATLSYIDMVLRGTDAGLLTDSANQEMTRLLGEIVNSPSAVAANPAPTADGLMNTAAMLPVARGRQFEQEARDTAASFKRSAGQHLRALKTEAEEVGRQLTEVSTRLDQHHADATTAADTKLAELQARVEEMQGVAAAAAESVKAEAERQAEVFDTRQGEMDLEAQEHWAAAQATLEAQAGGLVTDLERMRNEAQDLVGAVSAASTANHFRDDAKRERLSYRVLLSASVLALILAVVFAIAAAAQNEPDVQRMIAKLGITAALVTMGLVAGKQAQDHRNREKQLLDRELDMRAFGPFIEPLPPLDKLRERILMARRFFAAGRADDDTADIKVLTPAEDLDITATDLRQSTSAPS